MTLTNSKLLKNKSPKSSGGIDIEYDAKITKCIFDGNLATEHGGGIYNAGNTTVKSSTFINSQVFNFFSGAIDTYAQFKIHESTIKNNKGKYGGSTTVYSWWKK